jgi:hypothetical protein
MKTLIFTKIGIDNQIHKYRKNNMLYCCTCCIKNIGFMNAKIFLSSQKF